MPKKALFDEFQETSAKAWKQKIQYDLKGADYNEKLVWESPEGIKVKPFYHLDDLGPTDPKATQRPTSWNIAQEIFVANAPEANVKAQHMLQKGAESLVFTIPTDNIPIEKLLAHIDLEMVPLHFQFQFLSPSYIQQLVDFLKGTKANVYLNIDPLGHLARTGNWFAGKDKDLKVLSEILGVTKGKENINALSVDMALYQNAGANILQQLAYAMAHVNEYLNQYGPEGVQNPVFRVSVGSNYFFEIAKLRALRTLWQALASEYGSTSRCHILVTPTKRNKTVYAYNTNMLRTTTECMSAVLGGADTLSNLPYDSVYHQDNEFAERMARNQLLLLKNESHFARFDDPAAGSYYLESLTEQIAEKALQLFKGLEAQGGFLQQLKTHTIQRKIRESAQKEQQRFDIAEEVLVGTNAYENSQDRMKGNLDVYPFAKKKERKTLIEPIIEKRLAEEVEQKRLKNEG